MKKFLGLVLVLFLAALPAGAALSCGNGASARAFTPGVSVAYPANPTAGDLLVVCQGGQDQATVTISSTAGEVWTAWQSGASPNIYSTGGFWQQYCFRATAVGGADTVTVTLGAEVYATTIVVGECTGFTGTITEDKGNKNQGTSGTATSGATGTLSNANEVIISAAAFNDGWSTTPSGFTLFSDDTDVGMVYKIVSATTSTTATYQSVFDPYTANIDTFYSGGAASGPSVGLSITH